MNKKLSEGIEKLGLDLSQSQINQLETYIHEVLEFNKTYNLMKADNEDEMAVNHILDSLAAVPAISVIAADFLKSSGKEQISAADIGSGGGCPGIPLSIAFPEFKFTLVERMEKRCAFLESAIKACNINNATVMCKQTDTVDSELFDLEVFRAFHPFDKKISKVLLRMLKKGGSIIAYKARAEKIQEEMSLPEVKALIPEYKKINLQVPFLEDHERNLVIVKK